MPLNLEAIVFVSFGNNFFILVSSKIWSGFLGSKWVRFGRQNTPRPEESSFLNIPPQVLLRNMFYLAITLTRLTVLGLAAMEWRSVKNNSENRMKEGKRGETERRDAKRAGGGCIQADMTWPGRTLRQPQRRRDP